jgi:hypothetical protein
LVVAVSNRHLEIIGQDPGQKTGLARFTLIDGEVKDWEAFEVGADGAASWLMHMLYEYRKNGVPAIVASERFIISGGTVRKARSDRYDAIELNGWARHLCRIYGHGFELQSAGDAKSAAPNDALREAGWWTPKTDGHALDATRHAVLRMMHLGVNPPWV